MKEIGWGFAMMVEFGWPEVHVEVFQYDTAAEAFEEQERVQMENHSLDDGVVRWYSPVLALDELAERYTVNLEEIDESEVFF